MSQAVEVVVAPITVAETSAASPLVDLARAIVAHACDGDYTAASTALRQLHQLRGRFPGYAVFRDMAHGQLAISAFGPVFCLGTPPAADLLATHLQEAIACCAQWLGTDAPLVLLHCLPEQRDLHYTLPCFPGVAILRLSSRSPGFPDDLRAVVFHEIAHCCLNAGVRLLDEGLAHYVATHFAGLTLPPPALDRLPGTRVLLSRTSDAMFGEGTDSDPAIYQAACTVGAGMVERIVATRGVAGLRELFASLAETTRDAEIIALVEAATGEALPRSQPSATLTDEQAALVQQTRQAIFAAWVSKVPAQLDDPIAALEAADYAANLGLLDSMIAASINRALLHVNAGDKLSAPEEARIDVLLKEAECLPAGRLYLWRGCRAVLTIAMVRPNLIKVATAGQQAVEAFKRAAELIPDDPDLLVQHATLLLNAPEKYGGDRDLGVQKLRRAMEIPEYRHHAARILEKYGYAVPTEPAMPPTEAPAPESAAPAPVVGESATVEITPPVQPIMLHATQLSLRLNAAFTLAPGELTIRQGERVGIVGRNGSGKTMLLETLLGLRKPDAGQITLSLNAQGDPRQQIGGLLQGADLPADIKVREVMRMHEVMYALTDPGVAKSLGLDELRERAWKQLSRGQKQRVMLWLALSHRPRLALLDEPSLGLDEWFGRSLRQLLASQSATVLLISHQAADLLSMDRVLCMADGRIVDAGPMPDLIERYAGTYKAQVKQALAPDAQAALATLAGLRHAPRQTDTGWLLYGTQVFDQSFRDFIEHFRIQAFSLEATSVEDFLAEITRT